MINQKKKFLYFLIEHFNAELERFDKEKVELQDEMKTKTTRLEDQLKIFDTQK